MLVTRDGGRVRVLRLLDWPRTCDEDIHQSPGALLLLADTGEPRRQSGAHRLAGSDSFYCGTWEFGYRFRRIARPGLEHTRTGCASEEDTNAGFTGISGMGGTLVRALATDSHGNLGGTTFTFELSSRGLTGSTGCFARSLPRPAWRWGVNSTSQVLNRKKAKNTSSNSPGFAVKF